MSLAEAADGECHYYLTRKRRYCRFQPKEGHLYCPEHACRMGIQGERKRVPCPLNPKHNCYEDDLEKHIRKCNMTKLQKATQEASYYIQSINKRCATSQSDESLPDNKKVSVKDLTSADLAAMIDRVNKLYQDHVETVESFVFEHPCLREEYCDSDKAELSKALGDQAALRKELLQQASLVGQLDDLGYLNGDHCFVEMGAGKGKLSHWIQKSSKQCANNSFLLVDRSSVRYKMDSFHKLGGAESRFTRIKIDIEDLCLGGVDLVNSSHSVVVVGKHLCGGATDMGIRCAVETLGIQKPPMHSYSSRSGDSDLSSSVQITHDQPETSVCLKISENMEASEIKSKLNRQSVNSTYQSEINLSPSGLLSSDCDNCRTLDSMVDKTNEQNKLNNENRNSHGINSQTSVCKHVLSDELTTNEDGCSSKHKETGNDTKRKDKGLEDVKEPPAKTVRLEDTGCKQKLPSAIMIALCCHHACTWDAYVGQECMTAWGVSPQEFDLLTRLSSWATCAKVTAKSERSRNSNEQSPGRIRPAEDKDTTTFPEQQDEKIAVGTGLKDESHETSDLVNLDTSKPLREQLTVAEREDIGRKCKRIIDTGRLHYLRSKGMKCFLRRYVDEELTPENIVLIAQLPNV